MREKLIELLENCLTDDNGNVRADDPYVGVCVEYEKIADYLIENGVVVPPYNKDIKR